MIHCHKEFVFWRWSVAHCCERCVWCGYGRSGRPWLVEFLKVPMIGCSLSSYWVWMFLHLLFYLHDYYLEHFYSAATVQDNKKSWMDCMNLEFFRRDIAGSGLISAELYTQFICKDSTFTWNQFNCQVSVQILLDIWHEFTALRPHFSHLSCFLF